MSLAISETLDNWTRMKPIWFDFILQSLTKQATQARQFSVFDVFLLQRTLSREGACVDAIESPHVQCRTLSGLTREQVGSDPCDPSFSL